MFVLTDGKNYIMENPCKSGTYISTSSPLMAKEFSYKQARSILNSRSKKMSWIKTFYMVDKETGQVSETPSPYKGNGGAYIGVNDIKFDETIIEKIYVETEMITGLAGWGMTQLKLYEEKLNIGLSKYDSAVSDIEHALQKYKEDNDGKNPQAHKAAKISYLLGEVRDKHKNIKQCMNYIKVLENAITYNYTMEKIKIELMNAKHTEYQGRTEYYQIALGILDCGGGKTGCGVEDVTL